MVELAGVTLALSIKVLVGVILVQQLKVISREKMAQPGSYKFVVARKLHCLTEPMHLGVSAPTERPRDVDEEARGQRPADAETRDLRSRGQRDQV